MREKREWEREREREKEGGGERERRKLITVVNSSIINYDVVRSPIIIYFDW